MNVITLPVVRSFSPLQLTGRRPHCYRYAALFTTVFFCKFPVTKAHTPRSAPAMSYYRKDGVKIAHDPYAEGMSEQYGAQGETDSDGFDPYADSVGAGIYGGDVKRDPNTGEVEIGRQYQNHNSRPGPVYSGRGYSAMSTALQHGDEAIDALLAKDPKLVNEISTGGATPLHNCGMSKRNQLSTAYLISKGGVLNALDTYGYTPLHRMASNNLPIGAEALLKAGASVHGSPSTGETPLQIAVQSQAREVIQVLKQYGAK